MSDDERQAAIDATRRWVADIVIGLNLCPFARRVFDAGRIRLTVTDAADGEALLTALRDELQSLTATDRGEVETTILIHPFAMADFLDYNDFLEDADRLVRRLRLRGTIQIASFHPRYKFEGTDDDAAENYTNRSPYPMLHLLREESVAEVVGDEDAMAEIPERNIATLRALGRAEMAARLRAIADCGDP